MNAKLQNVANLFRNARTRTIILITVAVIVVTILVNIIRLGRSNPGGTASESRLQTVTQIRSVPGGLDTPPPPEYQRLQEQQNIQQARQAEESGTSAIPTIVDTANLTTKQNLASISNASCCSVCCSEYLKKTPFVQLDSKSGSSPLYPSQLTDGTLVYDGQGKVIGKLGRDGKVRDAQGNVIGRMGPDGLVRDNQGHVVGSAGVAASGAAVYDGAGHLLGVVGPDGKVRDARGRVIGTADSAGIVRAADGRVIGRAGVNFAGTPVYDAQGKRLGTVRADGSVYDANGQRLGTIDSTGVLQGRQGQLLGKANLGSLHGPQAIPGAPVYDAKGRLIGTVGADGLVRDAHGRVLGNVGAGGLVYDSTGKLIGKPGATTPGTPLYDKQSRLTGTVGADGLVRDSQGKILAHLDSDGIARDSEGNPLGSTTPPAVDKPSQDQSWIQKPSDQPSAEIQATLKRQAAQISAQKMEQLKQQLQAAINGEALNLVSSWTTSPVQQYVVGMAPETSKRLAMERAGLSASPPAVKAGTIMHAILLTAVNSDEPGPVLAKIMDGPWKGGRLIGGLTRQAQGVMLQFTSVNLAKLDATIPINAVAIDENTARTALSSYTDNHYLLRYGSLFASAFLQGYGQAYSQSGQIITQTPAGGTTITNPNLSPKGKLYVALGSVGSTFSSVLASQYSTPPTVHVYSGTPVGILFTADVSALPK